MKLIKKYKGWRLYETELINQDPQILTSSPPEPDFEHVVVIWSDRDYVAVAESVEAAESYLDEY